MRVDEFDFPLEESSIAREPLPDRAASRMLVVDREAGRWYDRAFRDFPSYLHPGDCLVLNNSKVFPARLLGTREGAPGEVEALLLRRESGDDSLWLALVKPGKKLKRGTRLRFGPLEAEVEGRTESGERLIRFADAAHVRETIERIGHVPLPPYLKRADTPADRERYQTVFARESGSAAAPTAGLHFTPEILAQCREAGASVAYVTLHVGLGTFQPIRAERVEDVHLHSEQFSIGEPDLSTMRGAARRVCVGTTSVRALESAWLGREHETDLFISPGFRFQATGALLTNFHLPKSSLLMLVCAFGGTELILAAYRHAAASGYRFFSYGDCMLVI